jgi:hypothetical protein
MTGASSANSEGIALFVVTCGPYRLGLEAQSIDRITLRGAAGDSPWLGEVLGLGTAGPNHGRTVFRVGEPRGWLVDAVLGLQVMGAPALRPIPGALKRHGIPTWIAGLALEGEAWILLLDLQALPAGGGRP